MDHVCSGPNCTATMIGPNDFAGLTALAEINDAAGFGGYVIEGPEGNPEFFCANHKGSAARRQKVLHPERMADYKKPEEAPQLAPDAAATVTEPTPEVAHPPSVEGVMAPSDQVGRCQLTNLIIVCQKDRILGVFDGADQADGIHDMAKSLSNEDVFCIELELNKPGSYPMAIKIKKEVPREAEKGNGAKAKGGKAGKRVQQKPAAKE